MIQFDEEHKGLDPHYASLFMIAVSTRVFFRCELPTA